MFTKRQERRNALEKILLNLSPIACVAQLPFSKSDYISLVFQLVKLFSFSTYPYNFKLLLYSHGAIFIFIVDKPADIESFTTMNNITNDFTTMCRRHQKAVRSAEQTVDEMLQVVSELSEIISQRDNPSTDTSNDNNKRQDNNNNNDKSTSAADIPKKTPTTNDDVMQIDMGDNSKQQNEDGEDEIFKLLSSLFSKSKTLQLSLVSDHKSVGTAINKFGKSIDSATETKLSELCAPGVKLETNKINDAIANHLFREGLFDVGHKFLNESRTELKEENIKPFEQLYHIITSFRNDNLQPAIEWTQKNKHLLNNSNLEFQLHCLSYLQLLYKSNDTKLALNYAKTYLSLFPQSIHHIQKLMTCLLYSNSLLNSPYRNLIHPSKKGDIERCLSREYCRLQGLTKDSLLLTVTRCGTKAIPMLLKATKIASNLQELGMDDALPVEVDVGRDCYFHSIFTCPVSKEEASDGNNVPMILLCGHVLSKQSIMRLPRGTPRFKCPYCPREQSIDECKELHI